MCYVCMYVCLYLCVVSLRNSFNTYVYRSFDDLKLHSIVVDSSSVGYFDTEPDDPYGSASSAKRGELFAFSGS